MIDRGVLEHIVIAMIVTSIGWGIGVLCGYPIIGAVIAFSHITGFFNGREHDQNEVRWCNKFNGGHRAGAPWGCGFRLVTMDLHSYLGFLGPMVGGAVAIGIVYSIERLIKLLGGH